MPKAGRAGSDWMAEQLAARGITSRVGTKLARIESRRIVFADRGEQPFALPVAVPPHLAPDVVVATSGLTGPCGRIAVDPGTLATSHTAVYAVGDVMLIPLPKGMPLPKSRCYGRTARAPCRAGDRRRALPCRAATTFPR